MVLLRQRLVLVWALLVVVTLVAWRLAAEGDPRAFHPSTAVSVGVVLIALVKVRFVVRWFMEVRTAPAWLGWATDGWLASVGVLVLGFVLL
jgi:cytochrome b561